MLLSALLAVPASAHRLRPAIVTISFDGTGGYQLDLVLNLEAVLAGIGPEHQDTNESPRADQYNALRELPAEALRERFDAEAQPFLAGIELRFDDRRITPELQSLSIPPVGDLSVERLTTISLAGQVPAGAGMFSWRYAEAFGESALRLATPQAGVVRAEWLMPGQLSEPFPLDPALVTSRARGEIFWDYLVLGYTHIVPKGLDHILFVLGIFLLSLKWRPLLYQVTAFTLAHSITLALSLYGLVSVPASVVEPLIALSIVYVAVENIISQQLKPWRVWVVFGFGLLHGLGFAGVLTELGLPRNEFVTALIAFNVGVEFGQLSVIALAYFGVAYWFRNSPWYRQRIVIPMSAIIACIGAFWTVQRVLG